MNDTIKLNEGDVFIFAYKPEIREKIDSSWQGASSHCFDGQLLVYKFQDSFRLQDTYWGFRSGSGKYFTLEEALSRGKLKFICNLNDLEEIREYQKDYYDDIDLFDLSYQHNCYKYFAKRKGEKKSKDKMLLTIQTKIENLKREAKNIVESNLRQIESLTEKRRKVENGNLDIYI